MSTLMIFGLGVFVTLITVVAVVLVGLLEAGDPDHSRPEDLAAWEWALVRETREKRVKDAEREKASSALAFVAGSRERGAAHPAPD